MSLPQPGAEAISHSEQLTAHIRQEISCQSGWISFARFMELLLYTPGLGYYSAGARKFGSAGDFVTAPELTGLFGQALAAQLQQIMAQSAPQILEIGAGSGRLAADILIELEKRDALPDRYAILDLSADLRQRQQETLQRAAPHLFSRVLWLEALPEDFTGAIIANELLDAMPAELVHWQPDDIFSRGVAVDRDNQLVFAERPASGALRRAAEEIARECHLPADFVSEISLSNRAWATEWGKRLTQGALLLIDYGFPRHEYYHQQRADGTLMCHYRHHAHSDPFYLPGLQDVTVHVDFTAIIAAAHPAGLDLLGYTSQGQFLLNCGILEQLAQLTPGTPDYLRNAGAVNKLLLPHEMGELFKVIALGKGISDDLVGFKRGDQRHRL
jgi:SAM-dependent MidA family methyltransferase